MTTNGRTAGMTPPTDTRRIATLTGWLMVITFVTSVPAYFTLHAPVRDDPDVGHGGPPSRDPRPATSQVYGLR